MIPIIEKPTAYFRSAMPNAHRRDRSTVIATPKAYSACAGFWHTRLGLR